GEPRREDTGVGHADAAFEVRERLRELVDLRELGDEGERARYGAHARRVGRRSVLEECRGGEARGGVAAHRAGSGEGGDGEQERGLVEVLQERICDLEAGGRRQGRVWLRWERPVSVIRRLDHV